MSDPERKPRSPAIAAAVILIGAGVLFFLMPRIMLWLGSFSPWLAAAFGVVAVLAFFAVFWLRARYQRNHMR